MAMGDEKYLSLTTFRRSGEAVATAVWVVPIDEHRVGFWTSSRSGKAKRLAHTAKVLVQPSDARGRVKEGTSPIEATAVVLSGGDDASLQADVRAKVKAKYGFMVTMSKFFNKVGHLGKGPFPYGDVVVVITLA